MEGRPLPVHHRVHPRQVLQVAAHLQAAPQVVAPHQLRHQVHLRVRAVAVGSGAVDSGGVNANVFTTRRIRIYLNRVDGDTHLDYHPFGFCGEQS